MNVSATLVTTRNLTEQVMLVGSFTFTVRYSVLNSRAAIIITHMVEKVTGRGEGGVSMRNNEGPFILVSH